MTESVCNVESSRTAAHPRNDGFLEPAFQVRDESFRFDGDGSRGSNSGNGNGNIPSTPQAVELRLGHSGGGGAVSTADDANGRMDEADGGDTQEQNEFDKSSLLALVNS